MIKTASMFSDVEFDADRPKIQVLFESALTREIRILMLAGQEMREHRTFFPIVLQVLDGAIDFSAEGEDFNLHKGDLIALESNVPHSLKARADSVVRLSLSRMDKAERVERVVAE